MYPTSATSTWYPPVDILESRDCYLIRAELPGMKKEDINLKFSDGAVTLSGERKFDEPAAGVEYHRVERVTGKFWRSFTLPQTIKQEDICGLPTGTVYLRYIFPKPTRLKRNRSRSV
jgi:HSP20 family molecular chaperone IbpA